ncbi:MAG: thiamine pyrophosphate-binding protein [Kordiimonadaceae bacterium]|jgi:benzoylformate decarboxylase|nr:thiamine pyrophosphate-binding protein [Kordiimonadaceae bacterium]MBT6035198.1 thiamine pyrophosphate-binding protein [Kordiimonadaceae bacterium]MBT6329347.1 thiamine pyrophosphate-binding protein [Kordiimonadaceae bacterium]MBT7582472.1 thiamine pyrophosphate-binding protein [Kordiimonadaceae bacterium]
MFEISKDFIDNKIDRRTFMAKLRNVGVSTAGAGAIANTLSIASVNAAPLGADETPEQSRVVKGLSGGEVMAEFLIEWDVPYVFGLAGSEEVGFLDALVDRDQLTYVTCIHENAAMAMADGYSRATKKTSIVQLHSVAGASYALGQMVSCYRDRTPVVVTAGRQTTEYRGSNGFLEAPNLHKLPADYAQWTWDVTSAKTIPDTLRRAFMLSEAPPGGPTFLTFSKDHWETKVDSVEIIPRSRSMVDTEVAPRDADVKHIVDYLVAADRPMLFLDDDCVRHEVSGEVQEIAEIVGAGVCLGARMPCVYPNTHSHFCGNYGTDQSLAQSIDCFWALGGHMFKVVNKSPVPWVRRDAKIIHTSLASTEIGRNYPVDIAMVASVKATAQAVLKELKARNISGQDDSWVHEYTKNRRAALDQKARDEHDWGPISTSRLMLELDAAIDDDALITTELILSKYHLWDYFKIDHEKPFSERRYNYATNSGVLGWALAASIGVKMGRPERETWCFTGDGAFNFGSQALWSASRYDVPIGIVIFNNGEYAANRKAQNFYKGRTSQTGEYIGVNLKHPDIKYAKMAESYDIKGERVDNPGDLKAAIARCRAEMARGRPYVLDVRIERFGQGMESEYYDYFSVADS